MALAACLVDTNILLRAALRDDPDHSLVRLALSKLISDQTILYFTHQNIAEFWNAATRPAENNGFGLSPEEADREVALIERGMSLLPDSAEVYAEWRRIVGEYRVRGAQVHDARLVAAMSVHGVDSILTLNGKHFSRFKGIAAIHPGSV